MARNVEARTRNAAVERGRAAAASQRQRSIKGGALSTLIIKSEQPAQEAKSREHLFGLALYSALTAMANAVWRYYIGGVPPNERKREKSAA